MKKKITQEQFRELCKKIYKGIRVITNAMIRRVQAYINFFKAKYGIPNVKLSDCKPGCHISTSNIKTEIPSWSTYPGDSVIYLKDGRKVSDFHGTCNQADCKNCKYWDTCYAIRMLRYPDVAKNYIENTMYLRTDINGLEKDLVKQIKKIKKSDLFRFDVSGEIESFNQLIMFLSVAYQIPEKTFYVYTKNYKVLYKYFSTGCELPNNFHVLVSIWHKSGIQCYNDLKHHDNIHCFIYNDGFSYDHYGLELLSSNQCKAYDESGNLNHDITCKKCRKCWTKKVVWTYPH